MRRKRLILQGLKRERVASVDSVEAESLVSVAELRIDDRKVRLSVNAACCCWNPTKPETELKRMRPVNRSNSWHAEGIVKYEYEKDGFVPIDTVVVGNVMARLYDVMSNGKFKVEVGATSKIPQILCRPKLNFKLSPDRRPY
jgi:hypothetical protein